MKTPSSFRPMAAFTLVELLVVIAIIAILASLILPAINNARTKTKIAYARTQMTAIGQAVSAYKSDYARLPSSPNAPASASANNLPDFTYGTENAILPIPLPADRILNGVGYEANNSELVAILGDMLTFRNTLPTINANHARNPKRLEYLRTKPGNGDATSPVPEVGLDGVYRDPWSQPYYVTLDMNYDGVCQDALYRLDTVAAGGQVGTFNLTPPGANAWRIRGEVVVWSSGVDGRFDKNTNALSGFNEDNILSWFTP